MVGTVWSFDPVTRAWYKEKEMSTPRKNFGLAVMNGKLLAIGGQDKDGRCSEKECCRQHRWAIRLTQLF